MRMSSNGGTIVRALLVGLLFIATCAWAQTGVHGKALQLGTNTNAPGPLLQAPVNTGHNFSTVHFPAASYTQAWDWNPKTNIVVGEFEYDDTQSQTQIAFTLQNGVYRTLIPPGSTLSSARGINSNGHIVGTYLDSGGDAHGFLYSGGLFTNVDAPGQTYTSAFDINDLGQIVGYFRDSGGTAYGFIDKAGLFTGFAYPGSVQTFAFGINYYGSVVGRWDDGTQTHGFVLKGSTFTSLDCPGGSIFTEATGINDSGAIAGDCVDASGMDRGFIYSGGVWTLVDVPGAVGFGPPFNAAGTALNRIKNKGQLVGLNSDGRTDGHAEWHGFIATH